MEAEEKFSDGGLWRQEEEEEKEGGRRRKEAEGGGGRGVEEAGGGEEFVVHLGIRAIVGEGRYVTRKLLNRRRSRRECNHGIVEKNQVVNPQPLNPQP